MRRCEIIGQLQLIECWNNYHLLRRFGDPEDCAINFSTINPAVNEWVKKHIPNNMVPSPFGGYVPDYVLYRAKLAVKARPKGREHRPNVHLIVRGKYRKQR